MGRGGREGTVPPSASPNQLSAKIPYSKKKSLNGGNGSRRRWKKMRRNEAVVEEAKEGCM